MTKEKNTVNFQVTAKRIRDAELISFVEETHKKEELTRSEFCRKILILGMEQYRKPLNVTDGAGC